MVGTRGAARAAAHRPRRGAADAGAGDPRRRDRGAARRPRHHGRRDRHGAVRRAGAARGRPGAARPRDGRHAATSSACGATRHGVYHAQHGRRSRSPPRAPAGSASTPSSPPRHGPSSGTSPPRRSSGWRSSTRSGRTSRRAPITPAAAADSEAGRGGRRTPARRCDDRAPRPGGPAHPHARVRRDGGRRRHPRPRRAEHRARRHRDHRPRADRRRARRPLDGARPRPARSRSSSARRSRRSAATCSRSGSRRRSSRSGRCARRSPRSTTRAASRSRPTRSCPTRCAPRAGSCGGSSPTSRATGRTRSRRSTRRRSGGRGTAAWSASPQRARSRAASATPTPTTSPRSASATRRSRAATGDDLRRGDPAPARPTSTARSIPPARSSQTFGAQLRKYSRDARASIGGRVRRDGTRRDLGYPRGVRRRATARRRTRESMKIGLVTPYIYPLPGRREPARALPLREPPAARPRRAHPVQQPRPPARLGGRRDPHRAGLLDAVERLRRHDHACRRASCRRSATVLDREQFDVLHFHEPFVPFLSLVVLGLSSSVNVATFHAFGGFSPAYQIGSRLMRPVGQPDPRPDRGLGGRAALRRALLPGRLQGHPERRRHRPVRSAPCRSPAGRTARRTSCSWAGSSPARASSTSSRRTGSCARPAASAGSWSSAAAPRTRRPGATS